MIKIEKNKPLISYSTIKSGGVAKYFAIIKSKEDLFQAIDFARENKEKIYILGGGSNVVFKKKVSGLVLKNEIEGMEIVKRGKLKAQVMAKSGSSWSRLVSFCVDNKLYGIENLFLIYGTVGAAPVQNIGAYGVELKDVFSHLKAINLQTKKEKIFKAEDCKFGYRNSIFKKSQKGKYFIFEVYLNLSTRKKLKLAYGSIQAKLEEYGIKQPELKDVIKVISEIRNSKLPNPYVIPNAGSFFKNPEISQSAFKRIQKKYPEIPFFQSKNKIKIPAAYLIEQCGYKGKKVGKVAMYEKQALILTNQGGDGKDILNLAKKVKAAVKKKFGLDLSEEVNII